jgi:hypothetical protein
MGLDRIEVEFIPVVETRNEEQERNKRISAHKDSIRYRYKSKKRELKRK